MLGWDTVKRFTNTRFFILAVVIYGGIIGVLANIQQISLRPSLAMAFAVVTPFVIFRLASLILDEATDVRIVWGVVVVQYVIYGTYYLWSENAHGILPFALTSFLLLLIFPPLGLSLGKAYITYQRQKTRDMIVVLIADFANYSDIPREESPRVDRAMTQHIIEELHRNLGQEPVLRIFPLCQPIVSLHGRPDFEEAEKIGRAWASRKKPTIVVWGWYAQSGSDVVLTPHYEILWPPKMLVTEAELRPLRAKVTVFGEFEPGIFELQLELSKHISYLVAFTVGLAYLSGKQYQRAIDSFRHALARASGSELPISAAQAHRAIADGLHLWGELEETKESEKVKAARTMEEIQKTTEMSKSKYVEAENEYRLAIELSQGNLEEAQWGLAYVLNRLERYEEAAEQWSDLLAKRPTAIKALVNRGFARQRVGDLKGAIQDYRAAVSIDPDDLDANVQLGQALLDQGSFGASKDAMENLDEAIELLDKCTAKKRDDPDIFNSLGLAYAHKGQFDKAIATYQRGLKHAREERDASAIEVLRTNLMHTYGAAGDTDHWIAELKNLYHNHVMQDPVCVWLNEGAFRSADGRRDDAILVYQELLKLAPQVVEARVRLGQLLWETGDLKRAERELDQVLEDDPNSFLAWFHKGLICKNTNRLDEAVQAYKRALEIDPLSVEAHGNLATVLRLQGKTGEAIMLCRKAIELSPNMAMLYVTLGDAYDDAGDLEAAVSAYRRAMVLDSDWPKPHYELAVSYSRHGKLREAAAEFELTIALAPTLSVAYSRLADLYLAVGDRGSAIRVLQRQLEQTQDPWLREVIERKVREISSITLL